MPAISSDKVLVTGANGFIGSWAMKALLDAGFHVRGAVRDESKVAHLKNVFAKHGDKLEFVVVPDITKEGAFDDAALGVDAIVHTASPVGIPSEDPEDWIVPAVQSALGVLRSASRPSTSSVKRVVFVSSAVTFVDRLATRPRVYDETCWNESDVREVEEKGRAASQLAKYGASKVIAEHRASELYEQAKAAGAEWDFTVVVPGHLWVDVRDVAQALILALTKPSAGGQRIIISAGSFRWQDFILAASRVTEKAHLPEEPYDLTAAYMVQYSGAKARELLGVVYRSMEDTSRDILSDYEARGFI